MCAKERLPPHIPPVHCHKGIGQLIRPLRLPNTDFNIFISRVAKYYYTKRYALLRNILSHGNFDQEMRKCQFIQAPHVEDDTSRPISLCTTVGHHTHNLNYINVGTFSEEANRPGHAYKNIDMQTCVQTLRTRIIE